MLFNMLQAHVWFVPLSPTTLDLAAARREGGQGLKLAAQVQGW